MDWYEDEEMMRQCEEVSEEVEKIVKKNRRTWFADRGCAKSSRAHGFPCF